MSPSEIEAAKKKALASGTAGVFSLDQLKALGQTGDAQTDWLAGAKKDPLISGGGRAVIDPSLNLPAGNYLLPGTSEAYYYNPRSGQVSQEFSDWANSGKIERDDLTGTPKALIDSRDGGEVFRSGNDQNPNTIHTLDEIFKLGKVDGSYQDSQDRVLGLGKYQQSLTDKNGKKISMQEVPGATLADPATAPYTQNPSNSAGGFDRLMQLTGKSRDEVSQMIGGTVRANAAPIPVNPYQEGTRETQTTLEDSLADNYTKRATMWKGLQEMRTARGLNADTGTSEAERKRIYETYNRITDPAQRAAYLSAQDPGNLTDGLRAARYELRSGERSQIAEYEKLHPTVEYNATGKFGQPNGMQIKLTSGSATFSDPTGTGREMFVGNVPKSIEMVRPNFKNIDKGAKIAGGAIMGAMVGFATGGIPGAFLGGYTGGGGPLPNAKNISLKNSRGWGEWKSNGPHMMNLKEVGTAVAFARFTGSGVYGKNWAGTSTGAERASL